MNTQGFGSVGKDNKGFNSQRFFRISPSSPNCFGETEGNAKELLGVEPFFFLKPKLIIKNHSQSCVLLIRQEECPFDFWFYFYFCYGEPILNRNRCVVEL